jgi:hypothetical protein
MNDLLFILPYQSGTLARLAGALADAGIDLQGCSGQQFGPEGIIHLLVEDAAAAREAASRAGFVVRDEREVLVAGVEDRPGALAGLLAPWPRPASTSASPTWPPAAAWSSGSTTSTGPGRSCARPGAAPAPDPGTGTGGRAAV